MVRYTSEWLALVPLLPLLGAVINGLFGRWLKERTVATIGTVAVGAAFIVAAALFRALALQQGEYVRQAGFAWITSGTLSVQVGLLMDRLSGVMTLVVTGVSFLIHLYSIGYMRGDPGFARYFSYLNLFVFAMLVLVLGDNLPVMFVGWEGVGLCSYLLIGFWFEDPAKASAGKKAFVTNRIGDFGFLLGMFLLYSAAGGLAFSDLRTAAGAGQIGTGLATGAGLLLFLGACGKSAQIPLYVWLPDAMAGPTPVSALIHAATMVTAGVYMVARLHFVYDLAPAALSVVAVTGAATALFAATIGLVQTDIKKVLAYSTVSQLGFMFIGVGSAAYAAGAFHLVTHAFFKACLFLGAGSVIHGLGGEQDIRKMGGLDAKMPVTRATFLVACLAIAGFPPLSGFFSKDEILFRAFTAHHPIGWLGPAIWAAGAVAAFCTAFYMFRLYYLTFTGECRADAHARDHAHESPTVMTGPLVVLAGLAAVAGLAGMPAVFHLPNLFAGFLGPSIGAAGETEAHAATLEWGLMGVSVAIATAGWGAARLMYKGAASDAPARLAGRFPAAHRLLGNKYYVDEMYALFPIRFVLNVAELCWKVIDGFLIDIVGVAGSVRLTEWGGRLLARLQNGEVQVYLFFFAAGAAALIYALL